MTTHVNCKYNKGETMLDLSQHLAKIVCGFGSTHYFKQIP